LSGEFAPRAAGRKLRDFHSGDALPSSRFFCPSEEHPVMGSKSNSDPETESLEAGDRAMPTRLRLLALWDDEHRTFLLPDRGTVTVGRAEGVEFQISDPAMSRQHVKFHVGERVRVEDLSSANGTWVRGRSLNPGETVDVSPGDMIELGRTLLVVQRTPARARAVQIYTHDYFEARVDDECGRAERGGEGFAVVRTRGGGESERLIEERLVASVRPGDVLARYGPSEHELLWVDCGSPAAEKRAAALRASLHRVAPAASVGLACSPGDGRTAATLLERANAAVRGVAREEKAVAVAFRDGPMETLRRFVERVAATTMSVLITGETGVGKGLLAAELHRKSPRASGPFVAINCAELTESLLEAELFGYEKGIFTGADKAKPGLIETANGGTLLLDEIGEMLPSTQAKMLKVLEDREVRRVGSLRPVHVDLRLVACTNRDLEAEMERGNFRRDLYHRLAQFPLFVPPLRERTGEIDELARMFAAQAAQAKEGNSVPVISPEALAALRGHPWPGNVRELRNVIERAVVLCTDGVIRPEHLPVEHLRTTVYAPAAPRPAAAASEPGTAGETPERQRILDALAACGGNQGRAAKALGMSRRTLVSKLEKHALPRPRKPRK
jgi:two-component system response regulator AtoC